eukprot:TRINITY_DN45259_c0_g1_i1.p1 TRINITY_DN45259_c0_g1~~TRINITY_DN45259_c0_g1_i1.p1  ORF type:complete len:342 (-),score=43.47 TRINITY_DN45259_c0_g1_i1:149-1174(-)
MDTKLGDIAPQSPIGRCCSCCCSVFVFVMIILFGPASVGQVDRLHYGLAKDTISGRVDLDHVLQPGRYYVGFWSQMILFPSHLFTIEFSNEKPEEGVDHLSVLQTRDQDGKSIFLDISVQVRLSQKGVGELYKEMLDQYKSVFTAELRDDLAKAANNFKISDAWNKYPEITSLLTDACKRALATRHAECWALQLWGIRLESKYEAALIKTQVTKQAKRTEDQRKRHLIVRANTSVILANYKKNKTIIEANGTAEKFMIEKAANADAEANLIKAQANATALIKSIVRVNGKPPMTDEQVVEYMKRIMILNKTDTNFLIHAGRESLSAINAQAYRGISESGLR